MPNRLAKETSPYLLQHQDNPVDWYPWGEEALARSRAENKPILLSVGYSACHWCHVMAHESFENADTAQIMNQHFINIKVDREERPDLDQIYQNVAMIFTRGGGWPLTVFLTPDLKPFYGGTYFPPQSMHGRIGFPDLLRMLTDAYHSRSQEISENVEKIADYIQSAEKIGVPAVGASFEAASFEAVTVEVLGYVDWNNGGLGHAPKFPNSSVFAYLWRYGTSKAREAVVHTLTQMARGGIYDQLRGGFSRYSVDERWEVPHFEKMLYDNGVLLKLYSEVVLSGEKSELFERVVSETVDYVLAEMLSPEGLFYAAQDADSDGEEGKFFVWTKKEVEEILTPEEARAACLRWGIDETGNSEHAGQCVLQLRSPMDGIAKTLLKEEAEVEELLVSAKSKLLKRRETRVRPGLDDKVLTSWNGMMISGLSWASLALKKSGQVAQAERAAQAAQKAFQRLVQTSQDGRLFSTIQRGEPKYAAYLDDYAFLSMAALDLCRTLESPQEIQKCIDLAQGWIRILLTHFKDTAEPGFFFTSDDHEKLIQRPKSLFDQSVPSGTSVALQVMMVLQEIDPLKSNFKSELDRQMGPLFGMVRNSPYGYGEFLCAALLYSRGPITVSGKGAVELSQNFQVFQKNSEAETRLLVCHQSVCSAPFSSLSEARNRLLELISR